MHVATAISNICILTSTMHYMYRLQYTVAFIMRIKSCASSQIISITSMIGRQGCALKCVVTVTDAKRILATVCLYYVYTILLK
jgi:hypothetical protein